ncbi:hypothetical protein KIPB_001429 [Kipferlia bialata]|uniref:Uncharacterized protein n=1 Tax=Kipferlia bialata TaxID=797122 RepID=A0A9K3CQP0_9EUKA|nr:hypothetical protein KIPB_001429 [Kipferlia bialata]|eukprot:g1429.t1
MRLISQDKRTEWSVPLSQSLSSVLAIRTLIAERLPNTRPDQVVLVYAGRVLSDAAPLSALGLDDTSTVVFLRREERPSPSSSTSAASSTSPTVPRGSMGPRGRGRQGGMGLPPSLVPRSARTTPAPAPMPLVVEQPTVDAVESVPAPAPSTAVPSQVPAGQPSQHSAPTHADPSQTAPCAAPQDVTPAVSTQPSTVVATEVATVVKTVVDTVVETVDAGSETQNPPPASDSLSVLSQEETGMAVETSNAVETVTPAIPDQPTEVEPVSEPMAVEAEAPAPIDTVPSDTVDRTIKTVEAVETVETIAPDTSEVEAEADSVVVSEEPQSVPTLNTQESVSEEEVAVPICAPAPVHVPVAPIAKAPRKSILRAPTPAPQEQQSIGTLVFFPVRGEVDKIRLMLADSGMHYDFEPVSGGSAATKAESSPFGILPIWKDATTTTCHSMAIMLHLAGKLGYDGQTPVERGFLMPCAMQCEDILRTMWMAEFSGSKSASTVQLRNKFYRDYICPRFTFLQRDVVATAKPYLLGDRLSYADLCLVAMLDAVAKEIPMSVGGFPELKRYRNRVMKRPNLKRMVKRGDRF